MCDSETPLSDTLRFLSRWPGHKEVIETEVRALEAKLKDAVAERSYAEDIAREAERALSDSMTLYLLAIEVKDAEIARLREENERLNDIQHEIDNWCKAYPIEVFPEPDFDKVRELLGPGLLSGVSASCMRHITEGIRGIIDNTPPEGR